jgi:hypothetical protein
MVDLPKNMKLHHTPAQVSFVVLCIKECTYALLQKTPQPLTHYFEPSMAENHTRTVPHILVRPAKDHAIPASSRFQNS